MCGGGKKKISQAQKDQALSSRIRQSDYDMVGRIDRGLRARRLKTPEQLAAEARARVDGTGRNAQLAYNLEYKKQVVSETPVYGEEI